MRVDAQARVNVSHGFLVEATEVRARETLGDGRTRGRNGQASDGLAADACGRVGEREGLPAVVAPRGAPPGRPGCDCSGSRQPRTAPEQAKFAGPSMKVGRVGVGGPCPRPIRPPSNGPVGSARTCSAVARRRTWSGNEPPGPSGPTQPSRRMSPTRLRRPQARSSRKRRDASACSSSSLRELAGRDRRIDEWGAFQRPGCRAIVVEGVCGGVVRAAPRRRGDAIPPCVSVGDREARQSAGDLNGLTVGYRWPFRASRIGVVRPGVRDAADCLIPGLRGSGRRGRRGSTRLRCGDAGLGDRCTRLRCGDARLSDCCGWLGGGRGAGDGPAGAA